MEKIDLTQGCQHCGVLTMYATKGGKPICSECAIHYKESPKDESTAPQVQGDWREEFNDWINEFTDLTPRDQYMISKGASWLNQNIVTPLTSKIEEMRKDGWISVKDGLPEENRTVLAYHSTYNNIISNDYNHSLYKWSKDVNGIHDDVTHWMKLPEPPTQTR